VNDLNPSTCQPLGRQEEPVSEAEDFADLSDAQLALGISLKNENALTEVYSRHGIAVYQLALLLCGPTTAERVTHKVFLDLWDTPDVFDSNRISMRSYLLARTHRHAVHLIRNGATDQIDGASAASRHYDLGSTALALTLNQEACSGSSGLSDLERQAILLAYFAGYTVDQIADRLRQSKASTLTNLHNGMQKLRLDEGSNQ
jgi:RNA polymerase sigma-70 factor, ECF subfamily